LNIIPDEESGGTKEIGSPASIKKIRESGQGERVWHRSIIMF
jgi:hypothetical protein